MQKYNFEAIISDVDGTLLDTKQFIFQAFLYTAKTHHITPFNPDDVDPLIGKSLEACYKTLAPHLNADELCETHRTFQENNLQLSVPFPHTIETLKKLTDAGIKIAAVTTRSRRTSEKTLELAGLMPFITTVISKEDVDAEELKPHPKPILLALEHLNILPTNAVTLGDTSVDIESGERAKTKTIGVTYGWGGKSISKAEPDYIVDDMAEILAIILS